MTIFMPFINKARQNNSGFTLVELMVTTAIATAVLAAIYVAYQSQNKLYVTQEQVAGMQQNLRSAMYFMERDIRKAGLEETMDDGNKSGFFTIVDIRYRDLNDVTVAPGANGVFSSIQFSFDDNNNHNLDAGETSTYSVFDDQADGNLDLAWNQGTGRQSVAENIEVLAFAYAYDNNDDGELDFRDINGNGQLDGADYVVWAIDSNNDNMLDFDLNTNNDANLDWRDLDTNGDGVINNADDRNSDGDVDVGDFLAAGGASALPAGVGSVSVGKIRAVRVWLLVRSDRASEENSMDTAGINGNPPYYLGDRAVVPNMDPNIPVDFKRSILTTTIYCRNM